MLNRQQKRIRKRALTAFFIFLLILVGLGFIKGAKYIPVVLQLFFHKGIELKQTKDNKINLLLLGVGGGSHEGPNLTDTIIFASLDPSTKKVTLVSIPRDLWIPELKAKINTAYTFGEEKKQGGGLMLSKKVVSDMLSRQVDYAVKIDFSGFEKAVDMMGGLDIDIDNTFDDYQYPLSGKEDESCGLTDDEITSLSAEIATGSATEADSFPCRYEHLHFDKGLRHMDGQTALKYVRSRHSLGIEGSDFSRSKRQEKIISAFKDKIFSADTFLNPVKVVGLVNVLKDSIDMDLKDNELDDFVRLAQKMKGAKLVSAIVDTGDESQDRLGLLMHPEVSEIFKNQWVLIPRTGAGDYKEVQTYVECIIEGRNCTVGASGVLTPTPALTKGVEKN